MLNLKYLLSFNILYVTNLLLLFKGNIKKKFLKNLENIVNRYPYSKNLLSLALSLLYAQNIHPQNLNNTK